VLLVGVGAVIVWTSQSDSTDPGRFAAADVTDFCASVVTEPLAELTPTEDGRTDRSDPGATPPRFVCEITLLADEESERYLAITLVTDVRVEETVGDAREAYAGAVDFEESAGRSVEAVSGGEDDAGFVVVGETPELREYRAHLRDSNAMASVSVVVTGEGVTVDQARDALVTIGQSTLDVMGSK
jgi:hypothetical protein